MQGTSSADTAASRLQADTDLVGQRKSGKVCFQPKHMEKLTVQGLGGFLLPAFIICTQRSCWNAAGTNIHSTLAPNCGAAQYKCPKEKTLLSEKSPIKLMIKSGPQSNTPDFFPTLCSDIIISHISHITVVYVDHCY